MAKIAHLVVPFLLKTSNAKIATVIIKKTNKTQIM